MLEILVQTATGTSNLASTPVTFANNTVNGNSIIVCCGNSSTTSGDVSGITDTQGNVYQKAFTTDNALIGDLELWYTSNIAGGANTVTVAYTTGVSCAVIAREYYGTAYPINILDKQTSTTGTSAALSSGTVQPVQTYELLIGVGLVPLANTFTVGAGWSNLTTLGAPLTVAIAMEDQFVAAVGPQTATFGANASIQWVCGIGTFFLAPTGTTTSTSFTTSTSISSTSASSTSSSISSTSNSTSTSSTSTSQSSTSSSTSSTSSSVSSTSVSSTSSSTSISSTSTSISSTSVSSTSQSSTSSSTSVSSTSSSFSSTSSSISSTSSSVSSTSFSSTSSSSSTSTTTLPPPYITYSYQDLPSVAMPPPLFVQGTTIPAGVIPNPVRATPFGSPIAVGNTIILTVSDDSGATGNILKVTDTYGNKYSQITSHAGTSAVSMWFAPITAGGPLNVITVSYNTASISNLGVAAQEFTGLIAPKPVDKFIGQTNTTSTTLNSGTTAVTSQSNELVVVGAEWSGGTLGATVSLGAGYTNLTSLNRNINNTESASQESKVVTTTGTQSGTFTVSATSTSDVLIVTFKGFNNSNLNLLNAVQYGNVSTDDGDYLVERGSRYLSQVYKAIHPNNTDAITFKWKGRSTVSTTVSTFYIQIYNVTTFTWETVSSQTLVPADTDFQLIATQSTNLSNYYDANNVVTFRSYQLVV